MKYALKQIIKRTDKHLKNNFFIKMKSTNMEKKRQCFMGFYTQWRVWIPRRTIFDSI